MTGELLRYAGERLLRPRILALAVLVGAAAWLGARAGGPPISAGSGISLPMALLLAALLITPLRLIAPLDSLAALPPHLLPAETVDYLLPSRFCPSDRF